MTSPATFDEIVADLASMLQNFQGREYWDEIGPETRFFEDLGCVSIDAVVLGEQLQERYGQDLPFNKLLADLAAQGAQDLTVGQLAEFLERHQITTN